MREAINFLVDRLDGLLPRYGIVLGSGLGSLVDEIRDPIRVSYHELPGFPISGVSGHAGCRLPRPRAGDHAGRPHSLL